MIRKSAKWGLSFYCMLAFLVTYAYTPPAAALTMEEGADAPTRTLSDYIKDFVDVPAGATDWKVFGATKEISVSGKTPDGYDFQYYKPEFPAVVRALAGQRVTVKGFMFPLDENDDQKLFLFGPFPLNCPYQYHVGPSLVIEVHADQKPVYFDFDAITLEGTLELVEKDPENSTFYRLRDARLVSRDGKK